MKPADKTSRSKEKMKSQSREKIEELKKHFEANLLDGDKLEDCGKAMLSAELVFKYILDYFPTLIDEAKADSYEKGWADAEKNIAKVIDNLNTVLKNYDNKLKKDNL